DQADQEQQVHIVVAFFKEELEQYQGKAQHKDDGEEEIPLLIDHPEGLVPIEEDDQGLEQEVHRLKTHDRGSEGPVVRQGLETDRGKGHGTGDDDYGRDLDAAPLQGIFPVVRQVQKQEGPDQGQGQQEQWCYFFQGPHHRLFSNSTKNTTPPNRPIIMPMGTSKGKMIRRPRISQANRKMAPRPMV